MEVGGNQGVGLNKDGMTTDRKESRKVVLPKDSEMMSNEGSQDDGSLSTQKRSHSHHF